MLVSRGALTVEPLPVKWDNAANQHTVFVGTHILNHFDKIFLFAEADKIEASLAATQADTRLQDQKFPVSLKFIIFNSVQGKNMIKMAPLHHFQDGFVTLPETQYFLCLFSDHVTSKLSDEDCQLLNSLKPVIYPMVLAREVSRAKAPCKACKGQGTVHSILCSKSNNYEKMILNDKSSCTLASGVGILGLLCDFSRHPKLKKRFQGISGNDPQYILRNSFQFNAREIRPLVFDARQPKLYKNDPSLKVFSIDLLTHPERIPSSKMGPKTKDYAKKQSNQLLALIDEKRDNIKVQAYLAKSQEEQQSHLTTLTAFQRNTWLSLVEKHMRPLLISYLANDKGETCTSATTALVEQASGPYIVNKWVLRATCHRASSNAETKLIQELKSENPAIGNAERELSRKFPDDPRNDDFGPERIRHANTSTINGFYSQESLLAARETTMRNKQSFDNRRASRLEKMAGGCSNLNAAKLREEENRVIIYICEDGTSFSNDKNSGHETVNTDDIKRVLFDLTLG